jgi:hypothetical protein
MWSKRAPELWDIARISKLKLSDLWYKAKVSLGAKRVSRQEVSSVALNSHKISYD